MSTVVDFAGTGDILTSQGNICVVTDQAALVNAINLWICSFRGEHLYRPYEGGVVVSALLKPMSQNRAQDIRQGIMDGLRHNFTPFIQVDECTVLADFDNNTYWIKVKGFCPSLQVSLYDEIGIKPLV